MKAVVLGDNCDQSMWLVTIIIIYVLQAKSSLTHSSIVDFLKVYIYISDDQRYKNINTKPRLRTEVS